MPDTKFGWTNNKGITRDNPADIAVGIEAICDRLKTKVPQAKILLLGVFPKFFGKDNHEDINGTIAKLHDGERIFYLNLNDQLLKTEGAIQDRVGHLTDKGYQVWADAIRPSLNQLMAAGDPPGKGAEEKVAPGKASADARPPGGDGAMFFQVFVSRNDGDGDGTLSFSEFDRVFAARHAAQPADGK